MGEERGETPAVGEGGEEKTAYNAGASAPAGGSGAAR